jgi:multidrug efflux system outer membrane protein
MSLLLCGCPRRVEYSRPPMPVPEAWPDRAAGPAAQGAPAAADLKWQEFFTDQRLQSVIDLALANNRDLRVAALNVERVQSLYRIQRAELYPTVAVAASGDAYRLPRTASGAAEDETIAQFRVGFAASWELDLFGRIRSLQTAALERYLATEQARSAAQISLVSAVANTYLLLAADRENLRLAQVTLDAQQSSFDLIRQSRDLGIASNLDLEQARTQVEAARVDIARYMGQIAVDENALDLLVGAPVAAGLLSDDLDRSGTLREISAGLPSDVLLRRPDILAAEHQLIAFNANINAARASFFPRISLTAAAGVISNDLTNLFKPAAGTWNLAPQAALPIFDYGARRANYRAAELDRDIAVAEYQKSIQSAFREVSDALSLRTSLLSQQEALQALVNSLEETYRLSEMLYKGGIESYLSVLIAQQALYVAQQRMVDLRLARLVNLVNLYKVLGGGA